MGEVLLASNLSPFADALTNRSVDTFRVFFMLEPFRLSGPLGLLILLIMPNGDRTPYRLSHGRSPSPCHTSDSEETWRSKGRWILLARWVIHRWRLLVRSRRSRRYERALISHRVLPHALRDPLLASLIASYL